MWSTPTKTSRDALNDQKGKTLSLKGITLKKLKFYHSPGFRDLKYFKYLKCILKQKQIDKANFFTD